MGTLFVDKLDPQSGTSLELGSSGDTISDSFRSYITNSMETATCYLVEQQFTWLLLLTWNSN